MRSFVVFWAAIACLLCSLDLSAQTEISDLKYGLQSRKKCTHTPHNTFLYALLATPEEAYQIKGYAIPTSYELQLHCLNFSYESSEYLFIRFGDWSEKLTVQADVARSVLVWKSVTLLDDEKRYLVLSYGEESDLMFTALRVFDEQGNDCLHPDHPDMRAIVERLMKDLKNSSSSEVFMKKFSAAWRVKR